MNIKIVVPVWGSKFLSLFFDFILPMQLTKNNLPEVSRKHSIEYVLYTSRQDLEDCLARLNESKLSEIANVRIEFLNSQMLRNVYRAYGFAHKREFFSSIKKVECIFFLNADIAVSDQFFTKVIEKVESGFKVVQVFCPRALKNPITSSLYELCREDESTIAISADALSKLWLENPHPLMNYHFVPKDEYQGDYHPSSTIWRIANSASHVRAFHLHPVAIFPSSKTPKVFGHTVDDGWIFKSFAPEEIYVEERNREFFSIELSDADNFYPAASRFEDMNSINRYFFRNNPINFLNLKSNIFIGKVSSQEATRMNVVSNRFVNLVLLEYLVFTIANHRTIRMARIANIYFKLATFVVRRKYSINPRVYELLKKFHRAISHKIFRVPTQTGE